MSEHESLFPHLPSGSWGPFEWFESYYVDPGERLGLKRLNRYGPPPHGIRIAVGRYRLVAWFPRRWRVWRSAW